MEKIIYCEKESCVYNVEDTVGTICGNDEIELGGHDEALNSDAKTTGQYLTCYTFELRRDDED